MRNFALFTLFLMWCGSAFAEGEALIPIDKQNEDRSQPQQETADETEEPNETTEPAPAPAANMDIHPLLGDDYIPAPQSGANGGNQAAAPAITPGVYVPVTSPNYVEAGMNYYDVSHNYGNWQGEFVTGQYQTDPWNRWNAQLQYAQEFHDSGVGFGIGNRHEFDAEWFSDVSVSVGSPSSFLTLYRVDADINYRWLEGHNLITTFGVSWDETDQAYNDKALLLGVTYYFPSPWIIQANMRINDSTPGDVIAPSGSLALTYGYNEQYLLTGRVGLAREAYQILGDTVIVNSFTSYTLGANWRQWVDDGWGFDIGTEYYSNRYYDRMGGTVSVFKEFDAPYINTDWLPEGPDWQSMSSGFFFAPYIGADYQYTMASYQSNDTAFFADAFNGGDVHIGARVHKYFGFEASYFDTASQSKNNVWGADINTSIKLSGETLDAMGYFPLGETNAELIGLIGVARITAKDSASLDGISISDNGTAYGARFGGGAQYWLTDTLNVRGLICYQNSNFQGINDTVISSVGLNYQFK